MIWDDLTSEKEEVWVARTPMRKPRVSWISLETVPDAEEDEVVEDEVVVVVDEDVVPMGC